MNRYRGWLKAGLLFAVLSHTIFINHVAESASPARRIFGVSHAADHLRAADEGLIRQTTEVTCGPAAVASLLKFYFGVETSEDEIAKLSGTYENGTSSLFGLRNACRAKGFEAAGRSLKLSEMLHEVESGGVPVVVHFKEPSLHFALVIGRVGDFIIVSDPSQGNISMDVGDFKRRWSGAVLVVKSSRPANRALVERRKRSAETRLETLRRAGSLPPPARF
jgi:predicted double-glycine peptidase